MVREERRNSKVIHTELKNSTCLNSERGTLLNVLIVNVISHQEAERGQVDDKCVVSSFNESFVRRGVGIGKSGALGLQVTSDIGIACSRLP